MKHSNFTLDQKNGSSIKFRVGVKMKPANWIVSYPRSGNTFVRSLLANYFSGLERPLQLREIVDSTYGEHIETLWTHLTGKKAADRNFKEQWSARALYFEQLRGMTAKTLPLIKSHTLLGTIDGQPSFNFVPGDRIIHIVRHPCDVALSLSNFANVDLDDAINRLLTANRIMSGQPAHGFELVGSWAQHARSWMRDIGAPIHRIRYTDLVANTASIVMDMVKFLDSEPDPARARLAVDYSSFDRLRAEEREKGFAEAPASSAQPFFREGRPGQWLDKLTVNQARKMLNADPELIGHLRFPTLAAG